MVPNVAPLERVTLQPLEGEVDEPKKSMNQSPRLLVGGLACETPNQGLHVREKDVRKLSARCTERQTHRQLRFKCSSLVAKHPWVGGLKHAGRTGIRGHWKTQQEAINAASSDSARAFH